MATPNPPPPPPILASTTLFSTALALSPSALLPNADGQFALLTRNDISIFTPSLGIQVDLGVLRHSGTKDAKPSAGGRSELQLFKTWFALDKKENIKWPEWSNDVRMATGASGSSLPNWRAMCWSPTGLGSLGGCVMATLTTNNEVQLFEPRKNAHKGEWIETFDISSKLVGVILHVKKPPTEDGETPTEDSKPIVFTEAEAAELRTQLTIKVLECQATSISWSPQVEDSYSDFSLFAVGHKSGHISLWRRWTKGKMELLHRYRMGPRAQWIVALAWSPWTVVGAGSSRSATSCLAVADSQGEVWSLEITQNISSPRLALAEGTDPMTVDQDASGISAAEPLPIGVKDKRAASQLRWISSGPHPQLVYTKLGTANFATLTLDVPGATRKYTIKDDVEVELQTEGASDWVGATSLATCCGIDYLPLHRTIVLALSSSSFHAITLDPTPALVSPSSELPTSSQLTSATRQLWIEVARRKQIGATTNTRDAPLSHIISIQGAKMSGFAAFSLEGEMGWVYETERPDALTYRPNATVRTFFVLAPLFGDADANGQLQRLARILQSPPNSRHHSSLATLRSFLHFTHDRIRDSSFLNQLLAFLPNPTPPTAFVVPEIASKAASVSAVLGGLFGDPQLEGLRLRETVARFLRRHPNLPPDRLIDVLVVQNALAREIAKEVIARLGAVLNKAKEILGSEEATVSGRVLMAYASLHLPVQPQPDGGALASPDALENSFGGAGQCPACTAAVSLSDIRRATCKSGHEWERCSITLDVVASVQVRTCICCERKALVGFDKGKVVDTILRAATCCLYCGGRWMQIR